MKTSNAWATEESRPAPRCSNGQEEQWRDGWKGHSFAIELAHTVCYSVTVCRQETVAKDHSVFAKSGQGRRCGEAPAQSV